MARVDRRVGSGVGLALFLVVAAVTPVHGEFAAGIKAAGDYDGLSTYQEIRTDPATVSGIGYVHPVQVDVGAAGGDFVAIGTAKGVGVANCANDYDAKWTVYMDWVLGGVYNCYDIALDVYGVGGKPHLKIQYQTCTSTGASRWVLTWASVQRACLVSGATNASRVIVALETTGGSTVDRNIDVKYTAIQYKKRSGGSWYAFGTCTLSPSFAEPNYSISAPSSTACNTYLAPLD